MASETSFPHLQASATCPYPQPNQSSPGHPIPLLEVQFNIILPTTSRSSKPLEPRNLEGHSTTTHIRYDLFYANALTFTKFRDVAV